MVTASIFQRQFFVSVSTQMKAMLDTPDLRSWPSYIRRIHLGFTLSSLSVLMHYLCIPSIAHYRYTPCMAYHCVQTSAYNFVASLLYNYYQLLHKCMSKDLQIREVSISASRSLTPKTSQSFQAKIQPPVFRHLEKLTWLVHKTVMGASTDEYCPLIVVPLSDCGLNCESSLGELRLESHTIKGSWRLQITGLQGC